MLLDLTNSLRLILENFAGDTLRQDTQFRRMLHRFMFGDDQQSLSQLLLYRVDKLRIKLCHLIDLGLDLIAYILVGAADPLYRIPFDPIILCDLIEARQDAVGGSVTTPGYVVVSDDAQGA